MDAQLWGSAREATIPVDGYLRRTLGANKRSARELAGDQAERFCRLPAPSNPAEYLQREAELSALVQRIHAGGVAPGAGLTSAEQS